MTYTVTTTIAANANVDTWLPGDGRTVSDLPTYLANNAIINVKDYGALGDGMTDDTSAIQAAHDALPSTGGLLVFPAGYYLQQTDGTYVNITKPNVTIFGSSDAWVVSPYSADPDVTSGSRYLNGFAVTGNNCIVSVNMRGCLVLWTSASATDHIMLRDMTFYNMYNSGLSINSSAFDYVDIDNVIFDTSRDLTSDSGNYEAIERSANSTDPSGNLIRINRSIFRGVAGGVDCHNVKQLMVGGGTRFEGCDQFCIKTATLDNGPAMMNVTVDSTVTFEGLPVNPLSPNRHLSATGDGRSTPGTRYIAFLQMFDHVCWGGNAVNFQNSGVTFLDGSFIYASLTFQGARFNTCPNAIIDAQGTVTIVNSEFKASNVLWTSAGTVRSLEISRNRLIDSVLDITKNSVAAGNRFMVCRNDIAYGVDNNGPIRFTDYGSDTGPLLWVEDNQIAVTGSGNIVVVDLGTSGTLGAYGPNNRATAAAGTPVITGGFYPASYEQTTSGGPNSLYLQTLHSGEIVIRNTNATGAVQYLINDASLICPIGTRFHVIRDSATQNLLFSSVGGSINGFVTATATTQYASATFVKIAADTWLCTEFNGTWTFF